MSKNTLFSEKKIMRLTGLLIAFGLLFHSSIFAQSKEANAAFTTFLAKVVDKKGHVNYKKIKAEPAELDTYLKELKQAKPDAMNKKEKMALFINAYNAYTLKLIINNYPLKSIRDIPRSKRWKLQAWSVGGKLYSLEDMEHKILRPMGDARIHFAINCASKSCPVLLNEAYTADKLEEQLKAQTLRYLKDRSHGMVVKNVKGFFSSSRKIHLSKIFEWFKKDITSESGTLVKYIKKHGDASVNASIGSLGDGSIKYLDYDWSLNGH